MNAKFDSLIRANVKVSNSNDTASAYTISQPRRRWQMATWKTSTTVKL